MKITLGIVDDHRLFVKSLEMLINSFPGFEVVVAVDNTEKLLEEMHRLTELPDIVLIDVQMKGTNGIETARQIALRYPAVYSVALSTKDDDVTIINMLRAGCCSYLQKDIKPEDLQKALGEVKERGYYNPDSSGSHYRDLDREAHQSSGILLSEKERQFLQLACSEFTYKEIAARMHMAERTIDGYRESLFEKFNVQSRVGMVLEAIRRNYFQL